MTRRGMGEAADKALGAIRRAAIRQAGATASRLPATLRRRADVPGRVDADIVPSEGQLRRWACAVELDYQTWCFHHGFTSLHDWAGQRDRALETDPGTARVYSIVTPVHDTPPEFLRECVYSVLVQSWPWWELCLVDDASTDPGTIAELDRLAGLDPRIRLRRLDTNHGICDATNVAISMADGNYVAFLDHDDRLAPNALFAVEQRVAQDPSTDLLYSDRDLLGEDNRRTHPSFKPGFAPETLLDGNFMFHLMVYRRSLLERLGGYRREFEGSQDLDLALRAMEERPLVAHLPMVLYHWRQHPGSMAGDVEAKPYIFDAGLASVRAALDRRGIDASVEEIPDIWRGHYRVRLRHSPDDAHVVRVEDTTRWREQVQAELDATDATHLVVIGPGVEPVAADTIAELCAWLRVPEVAATTGRVLSTGGWIRHAGLVRRRSGVPLSTWSGFSGDDPGYGAMNVAIRNVSLVHPLVCAWRTDVLRRVGLGDHASPYAGIEAAVRADIEQLRFVYDPLAEFVCDRPDFAPESWDAGDAEEFARRRADVLTLDGHFNLNLDPEQVDCRIFLHPPPYDEDFRSVGR